MLQVVFEMAEVTSHVYVCHAISIAPRKVPLDANVSDFHWKSPTQ